MTDNLPQRGSPTTQAAAANSAPSTPTAAHTPKSPPNDPSPQKHSPFPARLLPAPAIRPKQSPQYFVDFQSPAQPIIDSHPSQAQSLQWRQTEKGFSLFLASARKLSDCMKSFATPLAAACSVCFDHCDENSYGAPGPTRPPTDPGTPALIAAGPGAEEQAKAALNKAPLPPPTLLPIRRPLLPARIRPPTSMAISSSARRMCPPRN